MSAAEPKPAFPHLQTALPLALLALLSAGIAHQGNLFQTAPPMAVLYEPETVEIAPRTFEYRADGEFIRGVHPVDAPLATVIERAPLTIMKYQVTAGEYERCVAEGACEAAAFPAARLDLPATGVSFDDASAYARWLSAKTGEDWTVPSDRQLAFAAGASFPDDASGLDPDNKNPALKWIADYEREAASRSKRDAAPRPVGSFGENQYGLGDFAGNVWEWTRTCHRRVTLYDNGAQRSVDEICGVRVAVGPHRSPTSAFIKDPRGGGCSVGTPPDNLGFRLVRASHWYTPLQNL
jgi:formylglycine-generating enzyme required for sulfatase activity